MVFEPVNISRRGPLFSSWEAKWGLYRRIWTSDWSYPRTDSINLHKNRLPQYSLAILCFGLLRLLFRYCQPRRFWTLILFASVPGSHPTHQLTVFTIFPRLVVVMPPKSIQGLLRIRSCASRSWLCMIHFEVRSEAQRGIVLLGWVIWDAIVNWLGTCFLVFVIQRFWERYCFQVFVKPIVAININ